MENILEVVREICTEIVERPKKERYTNDVPEEILKCIPNIREELAKLVEVVVESGFRREVAEKMIYGTELPSTSDFKEMQVFAQQPAKIKRQFHIDDFAIGSAIAAAQIDARNILNSIELPELSGSEKQINWAISLREKALKQAIMMGRSIDGLVKETSAKYWIEHR